MCKLMSPRCHSHIIDINRPNDLNTSFLLQWMLIKEYKPQIPAPFFVLFHDMYISKPILNVEKWLFGDTFRRPDWKTYRWFFGPPTSFKKKAT